MSASAFVLVDAILPASNHTISEYLRAKRKQPPARCNSCVNAHDRDALRALAVAGVCGSGPCASSRPWSSGRGASRATSCTGPRHADSHGHGLHRPMPSTQLDDVNAVAHCGYSGRPEKKEPPRPKRPGRLNGQLSSRSTLCNQVITSKPRASLARLVNKWAGCRGRRGWLRERRLTTGGERSEYRYSFKGPAG